MVVILKFLWPNFSGISIYNLGLIGHSLLFFLILPFQHRDNIRPLLHGSAYMHAAQINYIRRHRLTVTQFRHTLNSNLKYRTWVVIYVVPSFLSYNIQDQVWIFLVDVVTTHKLHALYVFLNVIKLDEFP